MEELVAMPMNLEVKGNVDNERDLSHGPVVRLRIGPRHPKWSAMTSQKSM